MLYFCASDIHSFYDEWMNSLNSKGFDINNPEHIIIVCGDLFDRGSQTRQVFDFVKSMNDQGRLIYVTGNHEDLLLDCLSEISRGYTPSRHHFTNGTVKTICDFCECPPSYVYDPSYRRSLIDGTSELTEFICENSYDYATLKNTIFVHGWIPCYQGLNSIEDATDEDWSRARWENGMERWLNKSCRAEGKTIVCGHWHCSWGWSHIRQKRKEFPQKSRKDFVESFAPFVDDGIVAIDACTAYSGICNVIVFDEEGNIVN